MQQKKVSLRHLSSAYNFYHIIIGFLHYEFMLLQMFSNFALIGAIIFVSSHLPD